MHKSITSFNTGSCIGSKINRNHHTYNYIPQFLNYLCSIVRVPYITYPPAELTGRPRPTTQPPGPWGQYLAVRERHESGTSGWYPSIPTSAQTISLSAFLMIVACRVARTHLGLPPGTSEVDPGLLVSAPPVVCLPV